MHSRYITHTSNVADGNMSFRYGETDAVLKNRITFLTAIGLDYNRCVAMKSEHEDVIKIVTKETPVGATHASESVIADVLITQDPNVSLLLTTADCIPLSLYDPTTNTVALIHLSRHTFVKNVLEKTFLTLTDVCCVNIANLCANLGPHISAQSYYFPVPLPEIHPKLAPFITNTPSKAHIDLPHATLHMLGLLGVTPENVVVSDIDTATTADYFSHVRSVRTKEPEGRLATVVALIP